MSEPVARLRSTGSKAGREDYGSCFSNAECDEMAGEVAALLKELGLLWETVAEAEQETFTSTVAQNLLAEADVLHDAREAANKPRLEAGQKVWVRCELVSVYQEDGACVRPLRKLPVRSETDRILAAARMRVHPDDIRTDKP